MPDIKYVEPIAEHCKTMAPAMRAADQMEVFRATGASPLEALRGGLRDSASCRTVTLDGVPVAMFGVVERDDVGVPWFLGTVVVDEHPLSMMKMSKLIMNDWTDRYRTLRNYVDAKNDKAIRWLDVLGFELRDIVLIRKSEFIEFGWEAS